MPDHQVVLDHFHKRLLAAVTRSSLLKSTVSRTGRLLDCSRFESVANGLSRRVLQAIVTGNGPISVDLRLRFTHADGGAESDDDDQERPESKDDKIVREHRAIYDALDRRMRRFAELVKRETGVQSLWVGYPLLHVVVGEGESRQWILAPAFLWPISIQLDHRREGRVLIARDQNAAPAQFNRAMAGWVSRQLGLELDSPAQDAIEGMTWDALGEQVSTLAKQFRDPPLINCNGPLEPVPSPNLLSPQQSPRFFNSAVLGIFRWQNEAILADIDRLKNLDRIDGVCSGFVSGEKLRRPPEVERPKESDRFQVYDADFSQERVIWQARHEPGLVVHGPPGTGKSQTIVNVIADALAHRRTVLMVCQKYAATRVVFEKLKQVGLDGLCVEVMDIEKGRLPIFRAIRDQVDSLPTQANVVSQSKRDRLAREIDRLESELDDYARAMHERDGKVGLAYRQMKSIEGETYVSFPTVRPLPSLQPHVADLSAQELENLSRDISESGRLFDIAEPLTNPWRHYQPTIQVTPVLHSDVHAAINRLRELDSGHVSQVQKNGAGIDLIGDIATFNKVVSQVMPALRDIANNLQSGHTVLLRAWIEQLRGVLPDAWGIHRTECESAVTLAQQVANTPLDSTWHDRCQHTDGRQLLEFAADARTTLEFEGRWSRVFSFRFRRARRTLHRFEPNSNDTAVWQMAHQLIGYASARRLRTELAELNNRMVPGRRPKPDERSQIQFPSVTYREFQRAELLCLHEVHHPWLKHFLDAIVANDDSASLIGVIDAINQAVQRAPLVAELFRALSAFGTYLKQDALVEPEQLARSGKSISPWLNRVESGLDGLQPLMAWDHSRATREKPLSLILAALEEYEGRRLAGDHLPSPPVDIAADEYGQWWSALVRCSAVLVWQAECHRRNPILVKLTPLEHAQKVRDLQKALREKRNLEAGAIQATWLNEQIPLRNGEWKKIFQLRRSKFRDAKRLREAVEVGLAEGLLKLRPCWLVNPTTAAEVFPLIKGLFDVVIFDEASQCPIEQAVPAIYRGKAVAISGDEKQLPPTNFFNTGWSDDESEDETADEDATEELVSREQQLQQMGVAHLLQVEDLLAGAIGNLPEKFLSVHYRSKHPALIEFSNRAFYSGRLEAPPARVTSVNGFRPIRYHEVNGLYERRTNAEEAKQVVRLLKETWNADGQVPTVGVVTFNRPQRDLIEDLLDEECLRDASFRVRYEQEVGREEDNQDVGFFVKNLENVQGDERDVMVFSTTFGRDASGRFFRRFGPVGANGGERRLNVAVTRAKQQVIVLGSMPIDEVSTTLSANAAPGSQLTPAGYLQLYLAYAKAVSDGDQERINRILERAGRKSAVMTTGSPESFFEEDVLSVLEKLGFTVHSQVGESGFRIDLAVVAPDPKDGYLLGIECDGATYHSDRTARLRDVWRGEILRKRDWRLHRIWSTRWWYHRGDEIEALKVELDKACAHFAPRVETATERPREIWQIPLPEWKQLRDRLRENGDEEGLRLIGGLTTDFAHRYNVEQARKAGKPVPPEVLNDYPDLKSSGDDQQQRDSDE